MIRIDQLSITLGYYVLIFLEEIARRGLDRSEVSNAKVASHEVLEFDYDGSNLVETLCRNSAHLMFSRVLEMPIADAGIFEARLRDVEAYRGIVLDRGQAMLAEVSSINKDHEMLQKFLEKLANFGCR